MKKLVPFLMIYILLLILTGCSPAQPTTNPDLIWNVQLSQFEIKDKLESVETVVQYNGSYDEVHRQYPAEGNVYLIMNLTISKQGTDATPFDWSLLTVQDGAGNRYQRNDNDSFLEQHEYTPRLTGLEIKFGENEGWVCYEIPADAADGSLSLIYSGESSLQEITVK